MRQPRRAPSLAALSIALALGATGCVIPVQVNVERPTNEPPLILSATPDFHALDIPASATQGFTVWARDPEVDDALLGQLFILNPGNTPSLAVDPEHSHSVPLVVPPGATDPTIRTATWSPAAYCSNSTFKGRSTALYVYVTDSKIGFGPGDDQLPPTPGDGGVGVPPYDYKWWVLNCQ